jgi:hypothetical protein
MPVNGNKIDQMVMVKYLLYIPYTKVKLKMVLNLVKESKFLIMVINIVDNMLMADLKVMVSIFGEKMNLFSKEVLKMD